MCLSSARNSKVDDDLSPHQQHPQKCLHKFYDELNHVSSAWNYLDIDPWLPTPLPPGLTGSLPSPQVWVPPWLAQLSQPSQAPEKDSSHDVSRDLGLFNKPCRQSTQLAYGSRLLLPHETSKLRNKSTGSWKNLELQIQLFTVDN